MRGGREGGVIIEVCDSVKWQSLDKKNWISTPSLGDKLS